MSVKLGETSGGLKCFRRLLGLDLRTGLVDPHLGGQRRRLGPVSVEPSGVGGVGVVEDLLPVRLDGLGAAVMNRGGGVQPDAGMAVFVVVVGEEDVAEGAGVVDGPELSGEGGTVFQSLELRLAGNCSADSDLVTA